RGHEQVAARERGGNRLALHRRRRGIAEAREVVEKRCVEPERGEAHVVPLVVANQKAGGECKTAEGALYAQWRKIASEKQGQTTFFPTFAIRPMGRGMPTAGPSMRPRPGRRSPLPRRSFGAHHDIHSV